MSPHLRSSRLAGVLLAIAAVSTLALVIAAVSAATAPTAGATISTDPEPPEPDPLPGNSNFRTFCDFSHAAFDDPIVHPGDPGAAHLHFFFGNTGTNAYSTTDSLRARGASTCQGTWVNRSAYWIPAVFTDSGTPILPDRHDIYYKHLTEQPADEVQPLPADLMMIAGDASGAPEDYLEIAFWRCSSWPYNAEYSNSDTIPACEVGDSLRMSVIFPSCWDGVNMDSPDHQGHMSYVDYDNNGNAYCPPSHPVIVPQLSLHFEWEIRDQPSTGWYLSSDRHHDRNMSGGSTLHADWMNGWHTPTQLAWTTSCINEQRDCTNGSLGDGRALDRVRPLGSGRVPRMPGATGPHCNGRPATILGTNGADVIEGTPGDDVIVAYGGDDVVNGGGGFDVICSGSGNDTVDGGDGNDEIWSGSGDDLIDGGAGDDFVRAGTGNDEIRGGDGKDTLRGGPGEDTLQGGDEANLLIGASGNDTLTGGYWEDSIFGGSGDDTIDGLGSFDWIWGGSGIDECVFEEGRVRSCESS